MLRNMVTSLILHQRIKTTVPKAKELRKLADKMVTLAKKGTPHHRRQAYAVLRSNEAIDKLFSEMAERYKDRAGGYTRVLRTGKARYGDAADMAYIEYVDRCVCRRRLVVSCRFLAARGWYAALFSSFFT